MAQKLRALVRSTKAVGAVLPAGLMHITVTACISCALGGQKPLHTASSCRPTECTRHPPHTTQVLAPLLAMRQEEERRIKALEAVQKKLGMQMQMAAPAASAAPGATGSGGAGAVAGGAAVGLAAVGAATGSGSAGAAFDDGAK